MRTAWLRRLTPLLILALLAGAVALLHRELSAYRYEDVRRAIRALRGRQIEIALALTVVSYVILTAYDALALRYLGRPLAVPPHRPGVVPRLRVRAQHRLLGPGRRRAALPACTRRGGCRRRRSAC